MNSEVTLKQLMQMCVDQLSSIVVPVSQTEQIAIPIARVISDLKVGIQAISNAEEEQKKEEPEVVLTAVGPDGEEVILEEDSND